MVFVGVFSWIVSVRARHFSILAWKAFSVGGCVVIFNESFQEIHFLFCSGWLVHLLMCSLKWFGEYGVVICGP